MASTGQPSGPIPPVRPKLGKPKALTTLAQLSENGVAMSDPELKQFLKNIATTKSERLLWSLSDEQLDQYVEYFIDVRPHLTHPWMLRDYENRIKLLRKEKDRRSSQREHDEAIGVANQNVKWTRIVGILALIAAVGVPLMIQYCSRSSSTTSQRSLRPPRPPAIPQQSATGT
ncbi:MAG: hypothetical protein WCE87_11835, partial [Candidatus Udaeobacter sp.]